MKTSIIFLTTILIGTLLVTSCKSNQSEATGTQDSLKTAAAKVKDSAAPSAYSEYLTTPPNPDYTGDYMDRYPNGVIKFSGFFRFGKRHGQWMAFYDNGIKWSECYYDNGKRHGASNVYYEDGKPQYTGWFKNDKRDSLWHFYDKAGKEIDRRAFKNDVETGLVN